MATSVGRRCEFQRGKCITDPSEEPNASPTETLRWAYKNDSLDAHLAILHVCVCARVHTTLHARVRVDGPKFAMAILTVQYSRREGGSGSVCWACERVWQTELAYKYTSQGVFKRQVSLDLAILEEHRRKRQNFIDGRLQGHKYMACKRTGEVINTKLKTKAESNFKLMPPADEFYALKGSPACHPGIRTCTDDRACIQTSHTSAHTYTLHQGYQKKFGDPEHFRHRGHCLVCINCVRAVSVLASESGDVRPWKLQRELNTVISKEDAHNVGLGLSDTYPPSFAAGGGHNVLFRLCLSPFAKSSPWGVAPLVRARCRPAQPR